MIRLTAPSSRTASAILSVWLMLPAVLSAGYIYVAGAPLLQAGAVVALAAAVYALPLLGVRGVRRFFIVWLPVGFLVPVYCYLIWFFGSVPGGAFITSVMRTTADEALGTLAGFGLVALLAPLSWAVYIVLLGQIDREIRFGARARAWTIGMTAAYATFGVLTTQDISAPSYELGLLDHEIWTDSYPSGPVAAIADHVGDSFRSDGMNAVTASAPEQPLLVILVIGETMRGDHLSINGYHRNTTPELAKRARELVSFTNVSAAANYTYIAVPYIVSQRVGQSRVDLVAAFRAAGFHTAWLSNQDEHVYNAPAELRSFSNANWRLSPHYDTSLLPKLAACLRQCGPRQLVVLHLLGSHFPYESRYPSTKRHFQPILEPGPAQFKPANRERFVNSYDNAIRATDEFLGRVLDMADQDERPAVVLMTADHGENLYDDERGRVLHSNKNATRAEAIVPLVVWGNQAFWTGHTQALKALRDHAQLPVTQTAVMPTLAELSGLTYPGRNDSLSLANPHFQPPGERLIIQGDSKRVNVDTLR